MFDPTQVKRVGKRYRIIAPYTSDQLTMIHRFLVPEPEGRGYFGSFVMVNTGRSGYWQLSETTLDEEKVTSDPRLFDLWYLLTHTLPEVCGYNISGILGVDAPRTTKKMHPEDIEMYQETFNQMAVQLIGVIRRINGDIPIVSNPIMFLNRAPKIVPQMIYEAV